MDNHLIVFPAHALLILEERLREQEAEGVEMPEGMPLDSARPNGTLSFCPVRYWADREGWRGYLTAIWPRTSRAPRGDHAGAPERRPGALRHPA